MKMPAYNAALLRRRLKIEQAGKPGNSLTVEDVRTAIDGIPWLQGPHWGLTGITLEVQAPITVPFRSLRTIVTIKTTARGAIPLSVYRYPTEKRKSGMEIHIRNIPPSLRELLPQGTALYRQF